MPLNKIDATTLFVSEPDPRMFGNAVNERANAAWTNKNWLKSRFHFSFAEYHDPKRSNFGVMRVMNDDLVQPARGFGRHGHRDMEIVTYVVRGSLSHQDSMGTQETLGPGSIQFMTAGTGVEHSEHNLDPSQDLRFIQMWFTPRQRGLKPNYGSLVGGPQVDLLRQSGWSHLVSDTAGAVETPVKVNTDLNIYVSEMPQGESRTLEMAPDRQAYVLCVEGTAQLESGGETESLVMHDATAVRGEEVLTVTAGESGAHVLVCEMQRD